ncbi:DUF1684 domain-containing protein [Microbacterium sp. No. 7]|uniref:DUF1684 domain-containing protein n=1 Tax=Microbacterium sp. No. 7 TaxID=1714373 RepID=UPI0006ED2E91|nr:DUF1684 domain-containing protein [Microbacterium sp. No. 7]ALJ22109.1 hypothetical protein AOA12_20370 [Microbacterium sp. No. 7]
MSGATQATAPEEARAAWETWRAARLRNATLPHGLAALDRTEWPGDEPAELAGLPGLWRLADGVIVGTGLPGGEVRLAPGESAEVGDLLLRNFDRRGNALRVFDPASPNRTTIVGIDAYAYDPAWRVAGTFVRDESGESVDVVAVDGVVTPARLAGEIRLDTPAGPAVLTVTSTAAGGFSAVLGDATNNVETYRFRFVELGTPEGDVFVVDFNRLTVPPCGFSPEYVCPTPLPGNRWELPVRAGEKLVLRG